MIFIRPVQEKDLEPLLALAGMAGVGLTTLPKDGDLLRRRILKSRRSLDNLPDRPGGESYLFVMEDAVSGRVVGASGIVSKVGGFEPFYAYRVESEIHESEILKVHNEIPTLTLVREHNGPCEIGSLFLAPEYRGHSHGKLLQLVRFLFIAEHPEAFEPLVVSEMRGMIDDQGHSPFWDAVGRHFFQIDFPRADHLSVVNKKFIADLMPRHPLYVPLLPAAAQAVIGLVHEQSRAALKNLQAEGFAPSGMIDIFDAGAIVSCPRDRIRAVRESRVAVVGATAPLDPTARQFILATASVPGPDFRACVGAIELDAQGRCRIEEAVGKILNLRPGQPIRYVAVRPEAAA